jgi:hypothetical protein
MLNDWHDGHTVYAILPTMHRSRVEQRTRTLKLINNTYCVLAVPSENMRSKAGALIYLNSDLLRPESK